jgi:putative ABC transport system ATP-binding protein
MVSIKNLTKRYMMGQKNVVDALSGFDCEIKAGEVWGIIGPSGSGKSTLLNVLGGLDRKYTGDVIVDGQNLKDYNLNYYRRYIVATIFQQFYLIPSLTVEENITLPLIFGKQKNSNEKKERLEYLLTKVGLKSRRKHRPNELSGGEAQRVAIARALITEPKIVLADEPTGNLDSRTGKQIIDLLVELNEIEKTTLLIVTHDVSIGEKLKNKIELLDGKRKNV